MEFGALLDQELSELRQRLAAAASEAAEAATQRANASFQQTFEKLRSDQTQIASENERLTAENAALSYEKAGLLEEKQGLIEERDGVATERDALREERDSLLEEKSVLIEERNTLFEENQTLLAERHAFRSQQHGAAEEARLNHRGRLLDRLVDVVDRIDHAGSVCDVLVALARGLRDDFARVAIFEVRDQQLEPIGEHGFTPEGAVARISSPVEADTFLAHAARARSVRVVGTGSPALSMQPFGGDPTVIVTLPIAVRGGLLALLYADDAGAPCREGASEAALKLAHVLQRHAALRIERLTIELKAVAELTAYATMLVDEVEYVYEADRAAQKPAEDRLTRLRDNLRCARQIFQQRVTAEGPAAESVLEDIVTAAARSKSGTPFGADLARVVAALAADTHAART